MKNKVIAMEIRINIAQRKRHPLDHHTSPAGDFIKAGKVPDLKTLAPANERNLTGALSLEQAKAQLDQQKKTLEEIIAHCGINNELLNQFRKIIETEQPADNTRDTLLSEIAEKEQILTRISVLDRIGKSIRDKHNSADQEYSSVSFLEERLRKAIITNIYEKAGKKTEVETHDLINLQGYTTKQLVDVSKADADTIIKFLDTKPAMSETEIKRLIKSYIKQTDIQTIINQHNIENETMREKLQLLTRNAAKYFLLLPQNLQRELLTQLKHNEDHVWNGTFIIGYYFLSQALGNTKNDRFIHDLEFNKGNEVGVLFKETLFEMFGNFVFLDSKGKMHPVVGLDRMAKTLSSASSESDMKGVAGEIIAAYYYKKALNMEAVAFGREVREGRDIIGEIDLLAVGSDGCLHDIEVKNWGVKDHKSAKKVVSKIKDQHHRVPRREYVRHLMDELNAGRLLVRGEPTALNLKGIKLRGIIVSESTEKDYIQKRAEGSGVTFDVVPLVPDWLTRGMYNPAKGQDRYNSRPDSKNQRHD